MDTEIIRVVEATYMYDYTLSLTFNNGEKRICDFAPLSKKGICVKLQDIDYFKNFTLDSFTVDWNNEIGFAPEYLYQISVPSKEPDMAAEPVAKYNK